MPSLLVLDVVGLTPAHLGPSTPHLTALAREGFVAELRPVLPAVTCTVQSTFLTGLLPRDHGIVANGWCFRELAEVWLWRQSNRLVSGEKVWERARRHRPGLTTAKLFWWYNMGSSAEIAVTPRPAYFADGRKLPDIYTQPASLRRELQDELGPFPLFRFWGPGADIASTDWIGRAAERVIEKERPDLALVYLPHLDYDLQRYGPSFDGLDRALAEVDAVAGRLIAKARSLDMEVIVLSEYGTTRATGSVSINRLLRREGFLAVVDALNGELLDPAGSRAFAVADHQLAHVYVRDAEDVDPVRRLLESMDGVDLVLDDDGKRSYGLDHPRSGELVCVAAPARWLDYIYWLDDRRAPDFARTVEIHRKPGYDPLELLLDPKLRFARGRIAWKLFKKSLGFRTLLDVIPLDTSLVRGTHGRLPDRPEDGPLVIASSRTHASERFEATEIAELILATLLGSKT